MLSECSYSIFEENPSSYNFSYRFNSQSKSILAFLCYIFVKFTFFQI